MSDVGKNHSVMQKLPPLPPHKSPQMRLLQKELKRAAFFCVVSLAF